MDLTAKLPNELWYRVFEYVSSMSHKFKLASVNKRFRRCIFTILQQPMALELDFSSETKSVNGCAVRLDNWPVALQVLAEKTQFASINFVCRSSFPVRDVEQCLGKILTILIEEDCLSEVTSLKTQSLFGCHEIIWCNFLAQCTKLQVLEGGRFDCYPYLAAALKNKPLTELSLRLCWYGQPMLRTLLEAPMRHKLRKMNLDLSLTLWGCDLAKLVRELDKSVLSDLEEIFILWQPCKWVHKGQLFDALVSSLPKLSSCHVVIDLDVNELHETVPVLLSVLNARDRNTKLAMVHKSYAPVLGIGCVMVAIIRQLKHHHPELQFDFDQDLRLSFELGNVSLCLQMGGYRKCRFVNCINNQCHSFYPCVLDRLAEAALRNTSAHVEDYRLDRCRVGRVAADLKKWKGIEVTAVNQDQDLITFTLPNGNPFNNITIHSGQCFFNPCIGCLIID